MFTLLLVNLKLILSNNGIILCRLCRDAHTKEMRNSSDFKRYSFDNSYGKRWEVGRDYLCSFILATD